MRAYIKLYKLRITVTVRSTGRIFNLAVEWICKNPGSGYDLASPHYRGLLCNIM